MKDKNRRYLLSTSLDVDFCLPFSSELRGLLNAKGFKPSPSTICKFSPKDHQTLLVTSLLMNNETGFGQQRSKPEIKGMKYYTIQDISLGQFLIENCFNAARLQNHGTNYVFVLLN